MYKNYKADNSFSSKDKNQKAVGDNFSREDYSESVTRYYADLANIPTLTAQEEKKIISEHCVNDTLDDYARTRLIDGNLKFVFKVASAYRGSGVPLCELISQGNEGLVLAIDKFKPSKGFRFYCYGIWWIKAKISQYIKKMNKDNSKMSAEINTNTSEDDDEGFEDDKFLSYAEGIWSDVESSESIILANTDEDSEDFYSQYSEDEPIDDSSTIEEKEKSAEINEMFDILTPQEYQVLRMNFGIGEKDGKKTSVRIISDRMNITQSRVKSLKDSALKKLREYAKKRPYVVELFA